MTLAVTRDSRHRAVACGCLMIGFVVFVFLTIFILAGGLSNGARFFLPSLRQDVTLEFLKFGEQQRPVNRLVLLERTTMEKLVKTVSNNYKVPGVGGLEFSDSATVSIDCPVSYNYYVDLKEPWKLTLTRDALVVDAPQLRLMKPTVDVGRIKRDIQGGWLVFGEDRMLQELERQLVVRLYQNATRPENLEPLRNSCRASLEEFIKTWVAGSLKREVKTIEVRFAPDPTVKPEAAGR